MPNKTDKQAPDQARYPTADLLGSKALSGYQRDFAAALLTKPDYTLQEAKAALEQFFKGGAR